MRMGKGFASLMGIDQDLVTPIRMPQKIVDKASQVTTPIHFKNGWIPVYQLSSSFTVADFVLIEGKARAMKDSPIFRDKRVVQSDIIAYLKLGQIFTVLGSAVAGNIVWWKIQY